MEVYSPKFGVKVRHKTEVVPPQRRSLLRCDVLGGETTPVHYDQIVLRAGPPTSITTWVPIGNVDVEEGGGSQARRSLTIEDLSERFLDVLEESNRTWAHLDPPSWIDHLSEDECIDTSTMSEVFIGLPDGICYGLDYGAMNITGANFNANSQPRASQPSHQLRLPSCVKTGLSFD